jgi:hypothetical protein
LSGESGEAYFIGVLLGRGSVENSDKHFATGRPFGKYVLRIPSFKHTPLGKAIIETLLQHENGLNSRNIIARSPKLMANPRITPQIVGQFCGQKLKNWHPISLIVSRPLLTRNKTRWKISNVDLAKRYLVEQEKYFERNQRSLSFVITHLQDTLKHFSVHIDVSSPEPGPFNMEYFSIGCHMPPKIFGLINKKYGLSLGDAYRYLVLPKSILEYSVEDKQEFIRGLADATAHFDQGPYWYGDGKKGLWQVRLTLLADSKPELAVQLCRLIQEDIGLPVLTINWIKGDIPEKKDYRGGRERHIILWVSNIRRNFPPPFFRNEWKEEFLEECWQEDQNTLKNVVGKRRRIVKNILSKCPRTKNQLSYSTACIAYGCTRQKNNNTPNLNSFSNE